MHYRQPICTRKSQHQASPLFELFRDSGAFSGVSKRNIKNIPVREQGKTQTGELLKLQGGHRIPLKLAAV
jgi:hypothetical protein